MTPSKRVICRDVIWCCGGAVVHSGMIFDRARVLDHVGTWCGSLLLCGN